MAVDGVSFSVAAGETFAIVGESGCGKTTLARMLLRLIDADSGEIRFDGQDLLALDGAALREQRRRMQMIFQDPFASLNPRMRVGEIVAEPLAIHEPTLGRIEPRERAAAMLGRVGLKENALQRYAHEFSGGQRQRIGIARALILRPKLVVADEPVSEAGRFGGRAGTAFAARATTGIRANVCFCFAQLAGGGASGHVRGSNANGKICGDGERGAGAERANAFVYAGIAGRGSGIASSVRRII
jgi:ABC-type lipoprotein export system ATPase subunit